MEQVPASPTALPSKHPQHLPTFAPKITRQAHSKRPALARPLCGVPVLGPCTPPDPKAHVAKIQRLQALYGVPGSCLAATAIAPCAAPLVACGRANLIVFRGLFEIQAMDALDEEFRVFCPSFVWMALLSLFSFLDIRGIQSYWALLLMVTYMSWCRLDSRCFGSFHESRSDYSYVLRTHTPPTFFMQDLHTEHSVLCLQSESIKESNVKLEND